MIILDACRADSLKEVSSEYSFLEQPDTIWSVGSASAEWMQNTFTTEYQDQISGTVYISGNPFTEDYLDNEYFAHLEEPWRYAWNDDIGTMPPRLLTDYAIDTMRSDSPDKVILHYMQPHYPFVPDPLFDGISLEDLNNRTINVWDEVNAGTLPFETVYDRYIDNLRFILDEIDLLLSNIDADQVIISSDHGNAFGEYWIWGHPPKVHIPCLREVPWYTTTATDEKTHDPEISIVDREVNVEDRLKDLGYI